ncbi:hypothetical protein COU57_06835 [Candidatus Pacearchaeota archaeon CG10_big_fil_rev_8_21_14_0_10_32_14]|nr:MAG: hypothetical protein COU57_06835 [Candidatus Pacearchaeota archaeon CG10_big_fil_rev_8_21_14_0_10_32_14]
MEIDSKKFLEIMQENFSLPIVKTSLGEGIKMDCLGAFIFSSVTGAGYLDNPAYPFTPKGLLKLFYNALDYKFVTGLFDNTTIKNTPYNLSLGKKFIFESDKIIIPVEFNSERELQAKLKKFFSEVSNPTDYIIQRIELSKKGNGMEPFMEYLICETMKKENYIVESQIPLSHREGSPDFGGYKIKSLINSNISLNKIHLIELSMIRLGVKRNKLQGEKCSSFIVGEAKTSTTEMLKQLNKYLNTKFFDEGFEIHPSKNVASKDYLNLFTIDSNNKILLIRRKSKIKLFDEKRQKEYEDWLSNYVKYYLIANLTNDEFDRFYQDYNHKQISSINDIVKFVNNLTYEEIFKKIREVL